MSYGINEFIPTEAELLVKGLEEFVRVILITEICILVLVVSLLAIGAWSCYREFADSCSDRTRKRRYRSGQLIQFSHWSRRRVRRCGRPASDCAEPTHQW